MADWKIGKLGVGSWGVGNCRVGNGELGKNGRKCLLLLYRE
jgi:hypothetical protein